MKKPPLVRTGEVRHLDGELPAVSIVLAGGFLALAVPVIRVGDKTGWRTAILVTYEKRMALWHAVCERRKKEGSTGYPYFDEHLVGPDIRRGWTNAENLWCFAHAVRRTCLTIAEPTHAVNLLHNCAVAALALTGEGATS